MHVHVRKRNKQGQGQPASGKTCWSDLRARLNEELPGVVGSVRVHGKPVEDPSRIARYRITRPPPIGRRRTDSSTTAHTLGGFGRASSTCRRIRTVTWRGTL